MKVRTRPVIVAMVVATVVTLALFATSYGLPSVIAPEPKAGPQSPAHHAGDQREPEGTKRAPPGAQALPRQQIVVAEEPSAGGAGPVSLEGRRFAGEVFYRDGTPVAHAGLLVRWAGEQVEIAGDERGAFSVRVPEGYRGQQVHVLVWDVRSTVFDGLVFLSEDARIYCPESPSDPIWDMHGFIELPSLGAEDEWVATLWKPAKGRALPEALATTECYGRNKGRRDKVRIRFMESGNWHHAGPVILSIYVFDDNGRRSSAGALPYESLEAFRDVLASGIAMHCPEYVFDAQDVSGRSVAAIAFLLPGQGFTAVTVLRSGDTFIGRVPEGRYFARGVVDATSWGEAMVSLGPERRQRIEWEREVPGQHALELSVHNSSGEAAVGAVASFLRVNNAGDVVEQNTYVGQVQDDGSLRIGGLVAGRYAIQIRGPESKESAHIELQVPASEQINVSLGKSAALDVSISDFRGTSLDVLQTQTCRLFYRVDQGSWRFHSTAGVNGSWSIPAVSLGSRVEIAIKAQGKVGQEWVGQASIRCLESPRQVVEVVAVATFPVAGTVKGVAGQAKVRLEYGDAIAPWDECHLEKDGAFELHERMTLDGSDPSLVVTTGGVDVFRMVLNSAVARPIRIDLRENR